MLERVNLTVPEGTPVAITITANNVIVRDVSVYHPSSGMGIYVKGADNVTIESTSVTAYGTASGSNPCPKVSPLSGYECDNIHSYGATQFVIQDVRLRGGSAGVQASASPGTRVSRAVMVNARGPFPRGQCFQFDHSNYSVLEDFYCFNDNTSFTEDNINVWRSSNVTVRRGVIDGNNSPSGQGVMFEGSDPYTIGGLLEDVDALHQGDGCFAGYPAQHLVMNNTRCAWTHCNGWSGRGKPMSGSLAWCAGDENGVQSHGIDVRNSAFYELCRSYHTWEASKGGFVNDTVQAVELGSFTPRKPVQVRMCWDP